ncbi:MAG: alginate export family protein [Deltaproteobacteria bacterium]|nr:alginate export family protein [Deltaproteobacteria bacterium]MBW2415642.1 alginate export family protein [Deltaproteobacteria bacterium]
MQGMNDNPDRSYGFGHRTSRWLAAASLALVTSVAPLAYAADADAPMDPLMDFFSKSKPTLDIRARWENANLRRARESDALTLRIRLGLLSPDVTLQQLGVDGIDGAFKAFIEYEGTEVWDKGAYFVPGGAGFPKIQGTPGKTVIADPSSHELNRAWLQYSGYDSKAKFGRQRIILDNARFVGNVGWRQNEQTYDSVRFTNTSIPDLKLDYSWIWEVQRIFGADSSKSTPNGDFDSQTHLVHATFTGIPNATIKAYAHWMDLENSATTAPGNKVYGASVGGSIPVDDIKLGYYGEWARQSDYGENSMSYHATYYHVNGSVGYKGYAVGGGWEHLGESRGVGFQTPLATLHKFNGWADIFLATPGTGLVDQYAWIDVPLPMGFMFKGVYHRFDSDTGSAGKFGREYDLLLKKKLPWGVTALAKLAMYREGNGSTAGTTENLDRFWLQLEYKYN